MATRKTTSKKSTAKTSTARKKSSSDDVIIDAVAEEIDPSNIKSADTPNPAVSANTSREKSTLRDKAAPNQPMVLIISLVALLLGGTGLILGGMAYVASLKKPADTDQHEMINKVVDDRITADLATALTSINQELDQLTIKVEQVTSTQVDDIDPARIAAIEATLATLKNTLIELSPNTHTHEMNVPAIHQHDDHVTQVLLAETIAELRAEIAASSPKRVVPTPNNAEELPRGNDTGWWDNLLSAFSITRITSEEVE